MHRLWAPVLEPLVRSLDPKVIVEIGAADGRNTANLLAHARRADAIVHVIEPAPRPGLDDIIEQFGDVARLHTEPSLDILPRLDRPDLVVIDGDHNWYTVVSELRAIEALAGREQFPVVVLHDIGWPYGRRDQYYAPERIPEEHRRPYSRRGMRPDSPMVDPRSGLNPDLMNALESGGPENGVLTAVEDFITRSSTALGLIEIQGFHGLGILHPADRRVGDTDLAHFLAELETSTTALQVLAAVERDRVERLITTIELRGALDAERRRHRETMSRFEDDRYSAAAELERAHRETEAVQARLTALARRRSVRLALRTAAPFRPVFRVIRRLRSG